MPIYEFFCRDCNILFNFYSKTVNTVKRPLCPRCGKRKLERQFSLFAMTGKATEETGAGKLPFDEAKMKSAMEALAGEAGSVNENDPRQAAQFMRKLTGMSGMKLGPHMETAMNRIEAGENPEQVEAEMGDLLTEEDPFSMTEQTGKTRTHPAPGRDATLYDL